MITVAYLKEHSNLPGPRGNLELLYRFGRECDPATVQEYLHQLRDETQNSPEEFAGMCGVLGFAMLHKDDLPVVFAHLHAYAAHRSWRIREAVAIAIQEISVDRLAETLPFIESTMTGDPYRLRAAVAGLCEPKLLVRQPDITRVLDLLLAITVSLCHDGKLGDGEDALRKALGYGWSVAVVAFPAGGKPAFESLYALPGRHIRWIVNENLKKNRLQRMDAAWVDACRQRLSAGAVAP